MNSIHPDEEELDSYLLGHLTAMEAHEIEEHLGVCQKCSAEYAQLEEFRSLLARALLFDLKQRGQTERSPSASSYIFHANSPLNVKIQL